MSSTASFCRSENSITEKLSNVITAAMFFTWDNIINIIHSIKMLLKPCQAVYLKVEVLLNAVIKTHFTRKLDTTLYMMKGTAN